MNEETYQNLKGLFSGYFHQDWLYDRLDALGLSYEQRDAKASIEYNLDIFKKSTQQVVDDTIAELEKLTQLNLNETQLRELLFEQLGSYVHAPSLGMTYQSFLELILSILKED